MTHNRPAGFPNWETDDHGYFASVTVPVAYTAEDTEWLGRRPDYQRAPTEWLPLAMQRWLAAEMRARWMYEVRYGGWRERIATLYFEKMIDAVYFKLRWSDGV